MCIRDREESARLETQGENNQGEIQNVSGILEHYRQERELLAKDLSAVQMETAGLQQKDNFLKENIRRVYEEIRRVKEEDVYKRQGLQSRIVLQVHDELLIEALESEAEEVKAILEDKMKHAAELSVSLRCV